MGKSICAAVAGRIIKITEERIKKMSLKTTGIKLITSIIEAASGKRIEIGCGDKRPQLGFRGADIRDCEFVDYVTEAWNLHAIIDASSVVEVWGRHFLEHLSFAQCEATLRSIHTVLEPHGILRLEVPDLTFHARQLLDVEKLQAPSDLKPTLTNEQHLLASMFGWQRDGFHESWDIHKSGYTQDLLERLLEHHGFVGITRQPSKPWNLNIRCAKDAAVSPNIRSFFTDVTTR